MSRHRSPEPPTLARRSWTVPAIAAGAVALTVASGWAIAYNDSTGQPMTFAEPTPPRSSTPSRTPTPAPIFPADLNAPHYQPEAITETTTATVTQRATATATRTAAPATTTETVTQTATTTVTETATVTATTTITETIPAPLIEEPPP